MQQLLGAQSRVSQSCIKVSVGLHFHLEAQLGNSQLHRHSGDRQNSVQRLFDLRPKLSAGCQLETAPRSHKFIRGQKESFASGKTWSSPLRALT